MSCNNEWLEIEILTGLQKLSCLSLDRTPAAEVLGGTSRAWLEALEAGREWDERRDADRIRSAFVKLAQISRRWPSVPDFFDALPPAPQPLAIGRESRPASPEVAAENAKRIREMLADVVRQMPPATAERDAGKGQLAQLERDLRQHYSKLSTVGTGS